MSSIINSVNLINWFNYKGNKNPINFTSGINVLVGTNNAGKTKLHNAFRFIICDEVILKIKDKEKADYKPVQIDKLEYLQEVYNNSSFRELPINRTSHVGVELVFQKIRSNGSKSYLLKKGFNVKKNENQNLEINNSVKQVFEIDSITKGSRRISEDFEEVLNTLLPKKFREFFIIEGEQMAMMTPMYGIGLKNTVKTLTDIHSVDTTVDIVDKLQGRVRQDKSKHELNRKDLSDKEREVLTKKNQTENENSRLRKDLNEKHQDLDAVNEGIKSLEASYSTTELRKQKLEELKNLKKEKEQIENKIDDHNRNFLDSFTNEKDFILSKMERYDLIEDSFEDLDSKFSSFIMERRAELNKKISKEEQRILGALSLSQLHPSTLESMIKENKCFFCNTELSNESKDFISNILIPHFKGGSSENDDELKNLQSLRKALNRIYSHSKKYAYVDANVMEDYKNTISIYHRELFDVGQQIKNFITNYGDEDDFDNDGFHILVEFKERIQKLTKLEKEISDLKERIDDYEKDISRYNSELNKFDPKVDEVSQKYENLKNFIDDIDKVFENIKEDIYLKFGNDLEIKATERFKKLMKNNPTTTEQKLKVEVSKSERGHMSDYRFEIQLRDSNENILSQPGGASSTLEPLSVVFGLIDISEIRTSYPFIADAPISRLTSDTKLSFFETLIEDEIFEQSIIITMDLWDNKENTINSLGESVLNLLNSSKGSSFIIMEPISNNEGVNFGYLLNGG